MLHCIEQNGFLSTLPYLAMFLMCYPMGMAADHLRSRGITSTATSRKLFNSIGMIGPGLCMVALAFTGCDSALAMGVLVVSAALSAAGYIGFNVRREEKRGRSNLISAW